MIASLLIFDDFLDLPTWQDVRRVAQDADYQTREHMDGHSYANIGLVPTGFTLAPWIGRAVNRPIQEHLQYFRLGIPGDGAGNIHVDNGEGTWATVLYLNSPKELEAGPNGTAFWRHRWMGLDGLPERFPERELMDLLNEDRATPEKWELRMVVPAKPNRLIVYPTHLFHSRYPLEPTAGRLVHTSFFT